MKKIVIIFLSMMVFHYSYAATHKKHYKKHNSNQLVPLNPSFISSNNFDFNFSGDVSEIPAALQQYDSTIKVLPGLGTEKKYPINLSLQDTNFQAIQDFIKNKTNGQAILKYDQVSNSLRIIYDTKIDVAKNAVEQSLIWQDGGTPLPVLNKNGLVLFPYGQYEPKVTCQPLQLCDIQLEGGEVVKGLMIGDSVQWNEGDGAIPVIYSGEDSVQSPHVVLKPTAAGLETTLLITTNKRTYYIKLFSANDVNVSRVGFYYPQEQVSKLAVEQNQRANESNKTLTPDNNLVNPANMHFNYKISGDTDASFKPVQIFDDGMHVYIQMSTSISTKDLPAFYVIGNDDKLQLINFRYKAPFYIVDKLFDKGALILDVGSDQEKIVITKEIKKGFWARLFG